MEKALNLYIYIGLAKKFSWVFLLHLIEKPKQTYWQTQYFESKETHCCNYLLLVTVVSLLLCLIYQLNFIRGMCVQEKTRYT